MKDDERWRNLMLVNAYVTDEELRGAMPFLLVLLGIVLVVFLIGAYAC